MGQKVLVAPVLREALRPVQQKELDNLASLVGIIVGQLRRHPLLERAVLEELLGARLAEKLAQERRYGPAESAAPCNARNEGFGGV